MSMIRRYAREHEPELVVDPSAKRAPVLLRRKVTYHGFDLEHEVEPVENVPPELVGKLRHLLAESLARGEARHVAAKNDRIAIEEIRESWRRSGGKTSKLGMDELTSIYEQQLAQQNVASYSEFRHARLGIDAESIVPRRVREQYLALPDFVDIRGREVPIRYDVEESPQGTRAVARLTLPEKLGRTLSEEELPTLDRPLRFIVTRGARGAARADTLEALREELDRPFTDQELAELDRAAERRRDERKQGRQERHARKAARELRRERAPSGEERRRGPRTPYVDTLRGKKRHPKRGR
jgi:hypothetical protein